jgi:methylenetetrahydrofolate dehydrogenase (NADP+) / methenyltetrahydrofolate cyclohydrolase
MPGRTLDGRALAQRVEARVRADVAALTGDGRPPPQLDVVLVGDDPASHVYVRRKRDACERVGIAVKEHRLPTATSTEELATLLAALNLDPMVTGVLLQLPLPPGRDEGALLATIHPHKDVDCFHPENLGRAVQGTGTILPATPRAVLALLDEAGVSLRGAHVAIVNHSNLIGRPLAALLLQRDATVTVCHKHTANLAAETRRADVLVTATGVPGLIGREHVKPGAVVIDVGIARVDGQVRGDVRADEVLPVASALTPVPGGVGPMTVAMLLTNLVAAARLQRGSEVAHA